MHRIFIALAVLAFTAGTAAATDKTDVMAVLQQWVDGFNKGDVKSAVGACADQTSIIDDMPPHEWHGAGGCSKWFSDFDAFAKTNDFTDGFVTLGKPRHIEVTADRAYVVVRTELAYKMKGTAMKESGSVAAFALQKSDSGWHITGWSWAAGTSAPVKAGSGG
jgi:ketosteroid isomerase-like protein